MNDTNHTVSRILAPAGLFLGAGFYCLSLLEYEEPESTVYWITSIVACLFFALATGLAIIAFCVMNDDDPD